MHTENKNKQLGMKTTSCDFDIKCIVHKEATAKINIIQESG